MTLILFLSNPERTRGRKEEEKISKADKKRQNAILYFKSIATISWKKLNFEESVKAQRTRRGNQPTGSESNLAKRTTQFGYTSA